MKNPSGSNSSGGAAVILPESPEYDTARLPWNLAADQRPAAICLASSAAEVASAMRYAADNGLRIAPQTTGHMAKSLPSLDETVLIKPEIDGGAVEVDPDDRTARIKAGATADEVVSAAAAHGLAAMHGSSPTVGAIGFLLGGGLGFYGRTHGFATNRIRSLEVVTVDGEIRTASPGENPDLFWALRGAGGLVGVVTELEIELLALPEVFAGATFWPVSEAPELLKRWRGWTETASESVTSIFRILRLPPLEFIPEPIRGVPAVCVDGAALDDEAGAELAGLFDDCGAPLMGGWEKQPSAAIIRLHGDPEDPIPSIADGAYLKELDPAAEEAFIDAVGANSDTGLIVAELRHLGGALARPEEGSGALSHVDAEFQLFGTGLAFDPDTGAKTKADVDQLFRAMSPWRAATRPYNFAERDCPVEDCFEPETVSKLEKVRNAHDPDRLLVGPH